MFTNSIAHWLRIATASLSMLLSSGVHAATIQTLLPDPRMLGEWVLDADHSDDASRLLEPRNGRRGPPPGDAAAGGPPPGGPPGPGREGPAGPAGFSGVPALDHELTAGRSFLLRIDNGRITLVYAGERERTVHDAGSGERVVSARGSTSDGEFGYSIAYREGMSLLIETPRGGGAALERYTLAADGRTLQLTLSTLPKDARTGRVVHRVFVRQAVDASAPRLIGNLEVPGHDDEH
jgi:hypothetical protein